MQVAVVGPTGVLGRALVPLFVEKGYGVRALARSKAKAQVLFPHGIEIMECDLLASRAEDWASMLTGCDAVLHIASAIPRNSAAPGAWDSNTRLRTDGVRILLQASQQAGVRRYIQQSITMAYPDHGDDWITEDMLLDSSPARGQVCAPVMQMEQMVRTSGLDWCILRGGSFVGKGTFQQDTIERLRAGRQVVACDGRNFDSLIHVADIAAAFIAALENAPTGSVFNIVAEPIRHGEYLDRLADSAGVTRPARDRTAQCPPSWRCSNQAAHITLGWQPRHSVIPVN